MYFCLSPSNVIGLSDMALADRIDPLGLKEYGLDLDDHNGCEEFMGELVDDVLNDQDKGVISRLLRWPTLHSLNTVAADLIDDIGVHPAILMTLGEVLATRQKYLKLVAQEEDGESDRVITERGHDGWEIRLAPGVDIHWHQDFQANVYIPKAPISLCDHMAGEQLRTVVSHPVLDRYDLKIISVYNGDPQTTSILIEAEYPMLNKNALVERYKKLAKAA